MLNFHDCRILVLGDVMIDQFVYGDVHRISPEAPVPVVHVRRRAAMPGGAGNVARNIAALGGSAVLIGLTGEDEAAAELHRLLNGEARIADALVGSAGRQTTRKMRIVAGQQQMLRLDEEAVTAATEAEAAAVAARIARHAAGCGAMVLSDYAKGTLTDPVIAAAMAAAQRLGIPVFVDPKSDDFARYRGAACVTPNARELALAARLPTGTETEVWRAAGEVIAQTGLRAILCTRAEAGMTLVEADGASASVPAMAREVFDVSGAGDTVIGTLALASAAGLPLAEAMRVANAAAGVAVGKLGTATVTAEELAAALAASGPAAPPASDAAPLLPLDAALRRVAGWKARGLRVGFTNGCFDLLHAGHVALLQAARARCDRLVVGLNDDASVRRLKGPERPITPLPDRAAVLAALASVDAVVAFAEDTPAVLIAALRPHALFKGADYAGREVVGAETVRADGGEVVLLDFLPGRSTTGIVERTRRAEPASA